VPDVIQVAASGRAKCRGCGGAIAKGDLRFGESLPNAFAEGETLHWLHLHCAALMRPEKFLPALEASSDTIAERELLRETAVEGNAHRRLPRLVRAERAPSGRAHCRSCRELIDKGHYRLALHLFEDGRFSSIGSIHVECSLAYFGTSAIIPRLQRLTPSLTDTDIREIETLLANPRPAAEPEPEADAGTRAVPAESTESESIPGLAKAKGDRDLQAPALRTKTGE
jgi:hypothetical protein